MLEHGFTHKHPLQRFTGGAGLRSARFNEVLRGALGLSISVRVDFEGADGLFLRGDGVKSCT